MLVIRSDRFGNLKQNRGDPRRLGGYEMGLMKHQHGHTKKKTNKKRANIPYTGILSGRLKLQNRKPDRRSQYQPCAQGLLEPYHGHEIMQDEKVAQSRNSYEWQASKA